MLKKQRSQEPFSQFCSENDIEKMKQRSILALAHWSLTNSVEYNSIQNPNWKLLGELRNEDKVFLNSHYFHVDI